MREGSLSGRPSITTTERPNWRDRRRYLWLLGTVLPLLSFAGWGLVNLTGLGLFWWIGPIFVFVVIPVVDQLFGDDPSNPPEEIIAWLERDRYYRYVIYGFLPLQYLAIFAGFWLMTRNGGLAVVDRVGIAVSMGSLNGIGINIDSICCRRSIRTTTIRRKGKRTIGKGEGKTSTNASTTRKTTRI